MTGYMHEMEAEIARLREQVIAERNWGIVTVEVTKRPAEDKCNIAALIDVWVARHGFQGIGDSWLEVRHEEALSLLEYVLSRDLAYDDSTIIPAERARSLATRFLELLSPSARYFTNGAFHLPPQRLNEHVVQGPSWTPLTQATFDTGVIALDQQHIGIIWVQDED
jgi:hypothetical protein